MEKTKISLRVILILGFAVLGFSARSQEPLKTHHDINVYAGIFEVNVNYEGAVRYGYNSYDKVRVGVGYGEFLTAGEGWYLNAAFVHLLGRNESHLEFNVGGKIMLTNSIEDPSFSEALVPDIYIGYRYEKPTSGIVFRIGVNYPTLVNIGVGYNF